MDIEGLNVAGLTSRLGSIYALVAGRTSFTRAWIYRDTRGFFLKIDEIKAVIARASLGHKKFAPALS